MHSSEFSGAYNCRMLLRLFRGAMVAYPSIEVMLAGLLLEC